MTSLPNKLRRDAVKELRTRTWFRFVLHAFYNQASKGGSGNIRNGNSNVPRYPLSSRKRSGLDVEFLPVDDEIIQFLTLSLRDWVVTYAPLPDDVDALTKISARDYWLGTKAPRTRTLDAFEFLFPGSKDVYETGPGGEPLWEILSGDIPASRSYLNAVVGCPKGEVWSYQKYFEALLEGLVAPVFLKELSLSNLSSNHTIGFHPVLLTWINEQLRHLEDDSDKLLPSPYVADQILGVFALWNICLAEIGPIFLELEWLLVGLCRGMVFSAFDDQVEEAILNFVRSDAERMDKVFSQANPKWLSFVDRWKGIPLVETL